MPRGQLALPEDDGEAIRLFAQDHIIQVRRSEKTGRILEVDHVEFGWMKPEMFYRLQKMHDFLPMAERVIEGGYRMKASLWRVEVGVGPISIPLGMLIFSGALGLYAFHKAAKDEAAAVLDLLALFLPFGELWYLYNGAIILPDLPDVVVDTATSVSQAITDALPGELVGPPELQGVLKEACYIGAERAPWPLNVIMEASCRIRFGPR